MSLNPQETYVILGTDGAAQALPGGAQFWERPDGELLQRGEGWLVSEFLFHQDWPTWEMHPHGDEFVYLLSGEAALYLDEVGGMRIIRLSGTGAVIVPRGVWHTAKVNISEANSLVAGKNVLEM